MDSVIAAVEHFGLPGVGWILATAFGTLILTGKLRTASSEESRVKELESRVTDRDQRIEDEREDKKSWQEAYLTVMQAREIDQKTMDDAIAGMQTLTNLMEKLRAALSRMPPPGGLGGSQ